MGINLWIVERYINAFDVNQITKQTNSDTILDQF